MASETRVVAVRRNYTAVVKERLEPTAIAIRVGPQGPTGPQGPMGPAGGQSYTHTQSSPSASWLIQHNLGRRVSITLLDSTDRVVYADIEHGSLNQATITFPSPITGIAIVT